MTEVVGREGGPAAQVVIGVDTHQDQHVAVAIDRQGVRLAECHAPATTCGYGELERWSLSLGKIRAFGIEARVEKDISQLLSRLRFRHPADRLIDRFSPPIG